MKKFLLVSLICLTFSTTEEDKKGPAYNSKNGGTVSCTDRYVLSGDQWRDDVYSDGENIPGGVSDCVDLQLWNSATKKYFDRCCYVRFQVNGAMHAGCVGLSEENYLDTTETIKRMENGDKTIWTSEAFNSKIYQLDCFSSFLKNLSIATILLLALFF